MPPTFKAFGFEFPLTRWAIYALSTVAVLGTAAFVYQKLYDDPVEVITDLKGVNTRLAQEIEEYGLHVMEEPTKHALLDDPDDQLSIRIYADHCVLIQRKTRQGMRTRLVRDLMRTEHAEWSLPEIIPPVYAAEQCQGGCLNPHPGQFRWWYGVQSGDWVEVWRQWPEGCMHVQMFHVPSRSWDTLPNGAPKVRWTCCKH